MLVLNRFDGDIAVIETRDGTIRVPRDDLPAHVKEGDVLVIRRDVTATAMRPSDSNQMTLDVFEH